jgi:NitT/TauT family transport system substrate-binding protein
MKVPSGSARPVAAITAALSAALLLAGCGSGSAQNADTIVVGTLATDSCSAVYTAKEKNFFTEEGLQVDLKSIPSGSAISSGVVGGSLQVGCSSIGSVASAYANGVPVRVVSQGAVYSADAPTSALMTAAGSDITSARQLGGRTVAVNALKNVTQVATQAWVDANGGDAASVKFIELPFSQMGAALAAGRVDAALIAEPDLTVAQQKGQVKLLGDAYDAIAKQFSISTFFAADGWAKGHKDALDRFRRAMAKAADYSNAHPDETAQILVKNSNLDPGVVSAMKRAEWETRPDLATQQPPLDVALKYGALPKPVTAQELQAP